MRLVAEIIGWMILGSFGLAIIVLISVIIWSEIETDLFLYKMRRKEKKRSQLPKAEK
jgi:hypothetical protein